MAVDGHKGFCEWRAETRQIKGAVNDGRRPPLQGLLIDAHGDVALGDGDDDLAVEGSVALNGGGWQLDLCLIRQNIADVGCGDVVLRNESGFDLCGGLVSKRSDV